MPFRMADGPVDNLPAGMDVYGCYVNDSGIGETCSGVAQRFPNARRFRFTTNGSPADCADVERGAMSSWAGYTYGYCAVSNVNDLVARFGRPRKLLTAHQDPKFGAHICSPACWPGLVTTADGTQHTDHGGLWDESLLDDQFFDVGIPTNVFDKELDNMQIGVNPKTGNLIVVGAAKDNGNLLVFELSDDSNPTAPKWSVIDVTDNIGTNPRTYQVI